MTVQSPAYAMQNSSHSAALFRQASTSFVTTTGVAGPTELQVTAGSGMTVNVSAGRAWIPGSAITGIAGQNWSTQGNYFALNDAAVNLTVATSDPVNPRIDAVYIAVTDSYYSGVSDNVTLGVVAGTPAPSPTQPALPTNALLLATISVPAGITNVTGNLTDQRFVFGNTGQTSATALTYVPPNGLVYDTSTDTTAPNTWVLLGNVSIPHWATFATLVTALNNYFPQSDSACYVNTRLGSPPGLTTGVRQQLVAHGAIAARASLVTSGTLNVSSLAGTSQLVAITTQWISGSGGYRADSASSFVLQVVFT